MRKLTLIHISILHPAQVKVSHEAVLSEEENLVQFFGRETGVESRGNFESSVIDIFILLQIVCSINIKQGGPLPFRLPKSHLDIFTLHAFLE